MTGADLQADRPAHVLNGQGRPIRGLYATGITIGPALAFGYIAARPAAGLDGRAAP